MFILKKGHQPGVYVPLRALFLVLLILACQIVGAHSNEQPQYTFYMEN